jgi:transcriptional regulator with XRE-family HTH domain
MTVGTRIKTKRKECNMTLEDVAVRIGVSRQTMSRYETGVIKNIPSAKIGALAKVLNTAPAWLMGWE